MGLFELFREGLGLVVGTVASRFGGLGLNPLVDSLRSTFVKSPTHLEFPEIRIRFQLQVSQFLLVAQYHQIPLLLEVLQFIFQSIVLYAQFLLFRICSRGSARPVASHLTDARTYQALSEAEEPGSIVGNSAELEESTAETMHEVESPERAANSCLNPSSPVSSSVVSSSMHRASYLVMLLPGSTPQWSTVWHWFLDSLNLTPHVSPLLTNGNNLLKIKQLQDMEISNR